jgi:hypothetical protein
MALPDGRIFVGTDIYAEIASIIGTGDPRVSYLR